MTGTAAVFKLAGVACILAGSVGWGLGRVGEERRRVEYLREILRIVRRMQDEIDYGKRTLPEICLILSECCGPLYGACFRRIYELTGQGDGAPVKRVWEEQVKACQAEAPLSEAEKAILGNLPQCLGMREEKQQARNIGRYAETAYESCRKAEGAYENKTRMLLSLSVLAGAFLTILLL